MGAEPRGFYFHEMLFPFGCERLCGGELRRDRVEGHTLRKPPLPTAFRLQDPTICLPMRPARMQQSAGPVRRRPETHLPADAPRAVHP